MDFLTAFLALIILKPMRRKFLANTPQEMEMNSAAAPATVLK
jgi:OFA family oxalate/formate antiporter-like MFS transporter